MAFKKINNSILMKKFKFLVPRVSAIIVLSLTISFFQNCGEFDSQSPTTQSSINIGSTTDPTPSTPGNNPNPNLPACKFKTNKPPVIDKISLKKSGKIIQENILNNSNKFSLNVGMDMFSGTDQGVELLVYGRPSSDNSENGEQLINDFNCNSIEGLEVRCRNTFTNVGNGVYSGRIQINPGDSECLGRSMTLNLSIGDGTNCLNPPSVARSQTESITIQAVNQCAPAQHISPPNPVTLGTFGTKVAIHGDTAVISAPGDDSKANNAGAAYVYKYVGTGWKYEARLIAQDGAPGDNIVGVAIENNTIVLGASSKNNSRGAAYIFKYSAGKWSQIKKLVPNSTSQFFGDDVAISNNRIAVGSWGDEGGGAVYVFSGSNWTQSERIQPPEVSTGDQFSWSLAFDGQRLVSGAPKSGDVYVMNIPTNTSQWKTEKILRIKNGPLYDFGSSVATDNSWVVVGAPLAKSGDQNQSGKAYLYKKEAQSWNLKQTLNHADPGNEDHLGYSVAIQGSQILVGARRKTQKTGAAYLFNTSGAQLHKLKSRKKFRNIEDEYGSSLGLSENGFAIIGIPLDDEDITGASLKRDSGGAYFVNLN